MSDIIICRLDGKKILVKHLARHLKLYHNRDYREYIGEYMDDFLQFGWNFCSICRTPVKGVACSGECIKKHYSIARNGIPKGPMSEDTKRKLSEDRKQKYANGWAPRIGKIHSKESNLKNSLSHIGIRMPSISGILNPACRPEVKEKISHTQKQSGRYTGKNNPMYGKTHTPETIRKIFSHRRMNKLEQIVADVLTRASIPYHFQYFITGDGKCKSYDFKIKGKPIIIEVDGDFWHGNPNNPNHYARVDSVRRNDTIKDELAHQRGFKVVRLWESDIKKDPSIILKSINT